MKAYEVNFDGLVGPTHNYAGLSLGNVASLSNAQDSSNPKEGAKQGLRKMKALHDLGLKQGLLPPQQRPDTLTLRRLGFTGTDAEVVEKAFKQAPLVLSACYSASSMWTANAATVSPSSDTGDQRVHFTPANLANKFHRAIEPETTARALKATFSSETHFSHHQPLPTGNHFGDEGAANHTRLCNDYGDTGLEFFVFGKYGFDESGPQPKKFPARQTYEASQAIARLHQLDSARTVFAQQNPDVIDQGVFHNDVICVGNQNVLFFHEQAFLNKEAVLKELSDKFSGALRFVEVKTQEIAIEDAVKSYLFNSQLVTLENGQVALIAPEECRNTESVWNYLTHLTEAKDSPISEVKIYDVKQSMKNGGGPACLRLRVVLNEDELAATNQSCLMSEEQFQKIDRWIDRHYRDRLSFQDLADPSLITEARQALDELTQILNLGSVYPFQL